MAKQKNVLDYEPEDPSVFATEGDQAASKVKPYSGDTDADKVREASQKTPSSVAKRNAEARSTNTTSETPTDPEGGSEPTGDPAGGEEGSQS